MNAQEALDALQERADAALFEADRSWGAGSPAGDSTRLIAAVYHVGAAIARILLHAPTVPLHEQPVRYHCHKCGARLYVMPHQAEKCGAPVCCAQPMVFGPPPPRPSGPQP